MKGDDQCGECGKVHKFIEDGAEIKVGDIAFEVSGKSISILTSERLALNFMQRMSGIATTTSKYVKCVEGTSAKILDTRKTTPGLRILEKYAVRVGGGHNHRFNLSDGVLIKDNQMMVTQGTASKTIVQ